MTLYNHYLRLKGETLPEINGIENVLNNPGITDADKESILSFVKTFGYKTANLADKITLFPPNNSVLDTWQIRAESKQILAVKDLDALVTHYEGKSLLESGYTDYEISEILELAQVSPLYATQRSAAVKEAYIRWIICKRDGIESKAALIADVEKTEKEEADFQEEGV